MSSDPPRRQGRKKGQAEKFSYAEWAFVTRKLIARIGKEAVSGSRLAIWALKNNFESDGYSELFTDEINRLHEGGLTKAAAINELSKLSENQNFGMGVSSDLDNVTYAGFREKICDIRRYAILVSFEGCLLNRLRYPTRPELKKMVEMHEIETIDKTQFRKECLSLDLPLADGNHLSGFRRDALKNGDLDYSELLERYPKAYTPFHCRPPDLVCHFLVYQYFTLFNGSNYPIIPLSYPAGELHVASVGPTAFSPLFLEGGYIDQLISHVPKEKAQFLTEIKCLLNATYEMGSFIGDDVMKLSQWAQEWPLNTDNRKSFVDELGLVALRSVLAMQDIAALQKIEHNSS